MYRAVDESAAEAAQDDVDGSVGWDGGESAFVERAAHVLSSDRGGACARVEDERHVVDGLGAVDGLLESPAIR